MNTVCVERNQPFVPVQTSFSTKNSEPRNSVTRNLVAIGEQVERALSALSPMAHNGIAASGRIVGYIPGAADWASVAASDLIEFLRRS